MTELEKIAYAKGYLEKLANGINPLDGQPVPDGDLLNNVRISRCLFYVSDILRQVVEHGGIPQSRPRRGREPRPAKLPFQLDFERRKAFRYSETPISISEIARRINELLPSEDMAGLGYRHIAEWLTQAGLLQSVPIPGGKFTRQPTAEGSRLGISTQQREGPNGAYSIVVYDKPAQQFILDNLDGVLELMQQ